MPKMHTVQDSSTNTSRQYAKITRFKFGKEILRSDHIAIVQVEDVNEIWIVHNGGMNDLLEYYESEAPWALNDGKITALLLDSPAKQGGYL